MFKIYPHSFNGIQIRGTVRAFPKASVCSAPWWILDGHFHVSFSFSHGFLADCTTFGSRICQYLFFFYTCNVSSSPGFHTCYSWHDILLLQRILNSKLVLTCFKWDHPELALCRRRQWGAKVSCRPGMSSSISVKVKFGKGGFPNVRWCQMWWV